MKKDMPLEKEKIMKVTASLFGEKGYEATSIRDIAQALDASIAMIYYYFKSKEEILFSVAQASGNGLLPPLQKARSENSDPLMRLRQMLFCHICMIPERRNEVRVFVEELGHLSKNHKKSVYGQHRKIYDMYHEQLMELKERNLIRFQEADFPPVVFAMLGLVNWTYRWYREGVRPIEEVARVIIDLFCHGILNKAGLDLYEKLENL